MINSKSLSRQVTSPVDPEKLSIQLMNIIENADRPYVVYTENDIPVLRNKANQGISAKALKQMKLTSDTYLARSGAVTKSSHPTAGRQMQSHITYLSITGMLTGETRYIQKAVEIAVTAARTGNVDIYYTLNNALCVGDYGHAYALAYDMLYNYLTDEERRLIEAQMEAIGEWIYVNSPLINTWGSPEPRRMAWNWNVVAHGALGLISLALKSHPEWLTLAIKRMQGYYAYAVDRTGAAMEGLHYVGYAFNSLAPLDNAIYRLSGIEMLDAYPAMQLMPYWSMNMTVPFGKEQAAVGQGDGIGNYNSSFYIINRYKQSDALWAWTHTYGLEGNGEFSAEYEGNGWSMPSLVLYEDQSLIATKPSEINNPLVQTYDKGMVIARDSWKNDASMITFTCGYGYAGCWNHPDDNSFTFYAKGESFIIDLGAGRKESSDHNVILADGIGMDYVGGATMVPGTIEENAVLENGDIYIRGNNTASYRSLAKLDVSIRHIIYSGGSTPFVIALDYAKAPERHTYSTNFYTNKKNSVEISKDGDYVLITGANNGGKCYAIPYSTDGVEISDTVANSGGKGFSTSVASSLHCQATVFITENPDGSMPKVDFSTEGDKTFICITRVLEGNLATSSYEFTLKNLYSPKISMSKPMAAIPNEVLESISAENAVDPASK